MQTAPAGDLPSKGCLIEDRELSGRISRQASKRKRVCSCNEPEELRIVVEFWMDQAMISPLGQSRQARLNLRSPYVHNAPIVAIARSID